MNFFGIPAIKTRTTERLHISKEPPFMSWATVLSFFLMALGVSYYFITEYFVLSAVFLIFCLLFFLNLMESWDLIMDKEENVVTLVARKWHHGFSLKIPEENVKIFPLSSIKSISLNSDHGIDIVRSDLSRTTIKLKGKDMRSLRKLKREMTTFLYLERMQNLRLEERTSHFWDLDPWSIELSESQDTDDDAPEDMELREQGSHYEYGRNIKVIAGSL